MKLAGIRPWYDPKAVLTLFRRIIDPVPGRHFSGFRNQLGVPQGSPADEQAFRVLAVVVDRKVIKTVAAQQNSDFLIRHESDLCFPNGCRRGNAKSVDH